MAWVKFTKICPALAGVPWVGLIASVIIPILVIVVENDVTVLASLYVLGECGASAGRVRGDHSHVLSSAFIKQLDIKRWQRNCFWALGLFLLTITLTIGVIQPISTAFSGTLIALALTFRTFLKKRQAPKDLKAPTTGWLSTLQAITIDIDPDKPKIMLAARGRYQSEYAVDLAKRRGATLFAIYVRPIRVMDLGPGKLPGIETDDNGQEALGSTAMLANEASVPFVPIYVTSTSIADEILDYTVTYGCDTLIMGKSNRSVFSRKLEGDVVGQVQTDLLEGVTLITRSAETPHASVPDADRGLGESGSLDFNASASMNVSISCVAETQAILVFCGYIREPTRHAIPSPSVRKADAARNVLIRDESSLMRPTKITHAGITTNPHDKIKRIHTCTRHLVINLCVPLP